jgi:serine/threonine-protein kinase
MLFELLTGNPPFQGKNALQVAYQHLNEDVPAASSVVPGISPAVDRLVGAATARDPGDRPHDATAMLFRARAVLDRLAPETAEVAGSDAVSHHDTAPLDLDSAEAAALDLARNGKRASSRMPDAPPALAGPRDAPAAEQSGATDSDLDGWLRGVPADTGSVHLTDRSGLIPGAAVDVDSGNPEVQTSGKPPRRWLRRRAKSSEQPKRRRRFLRPGRIIALILILASLAAGLVGWQLAGRHVAVPSVLGKSPEAAQAAVHKAHLSPQLASVSVYSETVKKGDVAAVSPPAGRRLARGAVVTLTLSLGPERYTVPTVLKLPLADAVSALRVAHLHPETPTAAYSDTIPTGNVISIAPLAGTSAKPQTPIAIVISKGPAPVAVPKLSGLTGDAAKAKLQKLGLKVTVTSDFSDNVAIGQVIGITPSKNLHRTQTVSLSVSKGPQMVTIPLGLDNDSPGYAKQVLQNLGLVVQTHSYFPGLDSSILAIRPGPGSYVRVGSEVSIYLY